MGASCGSAILPGSGSLCPERKRAGPAHSARAAKADPGETDQVVRRLSTMMRVMQFYGADKEGEAELLGEMRQTLAGLSKNQMTEVMRRLEEAAKAADTKKSEKSLEAAYDSH